MIESRTGRRGAAGEEVDVLDIGTRGQVFVKRLERMWRGVVRCGCGSGA